MANFLTKDDIANYLSKAKQQDSSTNSTNDHTSNQNPLNTLRSPRATSNLTGPRPPPRTMNSHFAVPGTSPNTTSQSRAEILPLSINSSQGQENPIEPNQTTSEQLQHVTTQYASIDDIASELSYPMQHKLSFNSATVSSYSSPQSLPSSFNDTSTEKYAVADEGPQQSNESVKYQEESETQLKPSVSAFDSILEGPRLGHKSKPALPPKSFPVSPKPLTTISVPLYKVPSIPISAPPLIEDNVLSSTALYDTSVVSSTSKALPPLSTSIEPSPVISLPVRDTPSLTTVHTTKSSAAPNSSPIISSPARSARPSPFAAMRANSAARSNSGITSPSTPTAPSPVVNAPALSLSQKLDLNGRVSVPSPLNSGIRCGKCEKPISGIVINAMNKRWHPDCFSCTKCGEDLEHVAFYEKDGLPYCHLDYHEFFSPRCDYCKTPIEDNCISALGKNYHPGHFFCRDCGDPFNLDNGGQYMTHEGHPFCEKCYLKKHGHKCMNCQEWIRSGEFVNALGGDWHKECFVCEECKNPFNANAFYARDGKPYCEVHLKDDKPSQVVCAGCHQSIVGRVIQSMGTKWHSKCFKCCSCGRELSASVPGLWKDLGRGGPICISCTEI